MSETKSRVF